MAYTEPGTTRRSGRGPLIVAILLLVGAVWWMGDALFDWDPFQNDEGIRVETQHTDVEQPAPPVAVTTFTEVWTLPQDNVGTPVQDLVTVSETVSDRLLWVRPNTAGDAQHPRLLAVLQEAPSGDVQPHAAQLQGILTSPDAILSEWEDLEPAERQALEGQQAVILVTDFQAMTEGAEAQPFPGLTTQSQSQDEPMVTR